MTSEEERAARLTGALWEAVRFSGGTGIGTHRYFPGAFDPGWLAALPPPATGMLPHRQPVALANSEHGGFERHIDAGTLRAAYERRRRTRVYEDIGWGQDGTWAALASRHLSRLAGGPRVVVSVYESVHGDETLHAHRDAWFGIIVQAAGVKYWELGDGLLEGGQPVTPVRVEAGDVLLLPKCMPHMVTTPDIPGNKSVHLVFAVDRDLTSGPL